MTKKEKLLFVHIPKTAGTSFRKGLEQYFGAEKVLYDYNHKSPNTSKAIITHFYSTNSDNFSFFQALDEVSALSGHVGLMKYLPFFSSDQIITFVRKPFDQIISHYNHLVTHYNYKETFNCFINRIEINTCQSRMLRGIPLELIGFIGLTEEYSQSITLINELYQLNLPVLRLNEKKSQIPLYASNTDQIELLAAKENQLYKKARAIFQERIRLNKLNQPWVYGFVNFTNNIIHGIAYYKNSDEPVELEIYVGNELIGSTRAVLFAHKWSFLKPPRAAFIGYQYRLPDGLVLNKQISVVVAKTSQNINYDI